LDPYEQRKGFKLSFNMHLSKGNNGMQFKKPKRQEDAARIAEYQTQIGAPKGDMPNVQYYQDKANTQWSKWKSSNLKFKPEFTQMK